VAPGELSDPPPLANCLCNFLITHMLAWLDVMWPAIEDARVDARRPAHAFGRFHGEFVLAPAVSSA